jgi:FkbM family methyltransferase
MKSSFWRIWRKHRAPENQRATVRLKPESVIDALYRHLLHREPDPSGIGHHLDQLMTGSASISDIIASFIASDEFRRLHPNAPASGDAEHMRRFINDHTQFGEFEAMMRLWVNSSAKHRIVVDVGANGARGSNSYDLMREFGWRGLLIEANPRLADQIHREFSGLDYSLINIAVSDQAGVLPLHFGVNDSITSLNANSTKTWGEITGTVNVNVERLGPILRKNNIPADFDLLSLDIEGEDVKVLNDLIGEGFYRPQWIIIEAHECVYVQALQDIGASSEVQAAYAIQGKTIANLILKKL